MKNRKLRNVLFSAFSAVMAGVVLFSVSVAYGDENPTVAPPGNGVSPTFTGLTVNGGTELNGETTVDGVINLDDRITTSNMGSKFLDIDAGLMIKGDIWNSNGGAMGEPGINIKDSLTVSSELNAQGEIKAQQGLSIMDPDGYITGASLKAEINDGLIGAYADGTWLFKNTAAFLDGLNIINDLDVNGTLDVLGEVTFRDKITTVAALQVGAENWLITDKITSSDPVAAKPILINTPLQGVGDTLVVNGDLSVDGEVSLGENFTMTDNLEITSKILNPSFSNFGNLLIADKVKIDSNDDGDDYIRILDHSINSFGNNLHINDASAFLELGAEPRATNVEIGHSLAPTSDLTVYGGVYIEGSGGSSGLADIGLNVKNDATFGGDLDATGGGSFGGHLDVEGKITAGSFGTYTRRSSNLGSKKYGETWTGTTSCLEGERAISCGFSSSLNTPMFTVTKAYPNINGTSCYFAGTNDNYTREILEMEYFTCGADDCGYGVEDNYMTMSGYAMCFNPSM